MVVVRVESGSGVVGTGEPFISVPGGLVVVVVVVGAGVLGVVRPVVGGGGRGVPGAEE